MFKVCFKKVFFAFLVLGSSSVFAESYADKWASIKYQSSSDQLQLESFNTFIDESKPSSTDERIWISLAKIARLKLLSRHEASSQVEGIVDELEKELSIVDTATQGMGAGAVAFLYAKLPGAPMSIGSRGMSLDWIDKALVFKTNPHVAFYLAFAYDYLEMNEESDQMIALVKEGFIDDQSVMAKGRLEDLEAISS